MCLLVSALFGWRLEGSGRIYLESDSISSCFSPTGRSTFATAATDGSAAGLMLPLLALTIRLPMPKLPLLPTPAPLSRSLDMIPRGRLCPRFASNTYPPPPPKPPRCCGVLSLSPPDAEYPVSLMILYSTGALATMHDAKISKLANWILGSAQELGLGGGEAGLPMSATAAAPGSARRRASG